MIFQRLGDAAAVMGGDESEYQSGAYSSGYRVVRPSGHRKSRVFELRRPDRRSPDYCEAPFSRFRNTATSASIPVRSAGSTSGVKYGGWLEGRRTPLLLASAYFSGSAPPRLMYSDGTPCSMKKA